MGATSLKPVSPLSPDDGIPLNWAIGVVGVNFKSAPIIVRESVARTVTVEKLAELKSQSADREDTELVLLSTCNRVEVLYFQRTLSQSLVDSLQRLFRFGVTEDHFHVYHLNGMKAVNHLFEVAAGLDSLVIGEAQILSQVREAFRNCEERGLAGPVSSKLFAKAVELGKKLRDTNPSYTQGMHNSVSHAVLELITKHYPDKAPNLLLIGSGKMVRLALGAAAKSSLGKVVVAARRREINGIEADSIVHLSEIGRALRDYKVDVLIAATSADHFVVSPRDLEQLPPNTTLLILDIAVPRNVDPQVKAPNITLLNLDDLKELIIPSEQEDKFAYAEIRSQLFSGAGDFLAWLIEYQEILPLLSALRRKMEKLRTEEVNNALSRLPELSSEQKLVIEKMTERLMRRFLHEPTAKLRQLARNEPGTKKAKLYSEVLQQLFSEETEEMHSVFPVPTATE